MTEEQKQKISAIVSEAEQRGLAFVSDYNEYEDNILSTDNEVIPPFVDTENALLWLQEKLEEVIS